MNSPSKLIKFLNTASKKLTERLKCANVGWRWKVTVWSLEAPFTSNRLPSVGLEKVNEKLIRYDCKKNLYLIE